MKIVGYHGLFTVERRIYSIDRLRLNPGGVPVRAVVYFAASVAGAALALRMPLVGMLAALPPWYVVYLFLPAAIAALLTWSSFGGRPAHLLIAPLARWLWGTVGSRIRRADRSHGWSPGDMIVFADGSGSRDRVRYRGPGRLELCHQFRCGCGRRLRLGRTGQAVVLDLRISLGADSPRKVLTIARGAELMLSSGSRTGRIG